MKHTKIFVLVNRKMNQRLFRFGEILDAEEGMNSYKVVEKNTTFFIPKGVAQKIHGSTLECKTMEYPTSNGEN